MPICAYTCLNEVTAHPFDLPEGGGQNIGESHNNSGRGTNKDTHTNPATYIHDASPCPNGCLPPASFDLTSGHDIPRIAYYIAGDTANLRDPRVFGAEPYDPIFGAEPYDPIFGAEPYDPIPNHTACHVVILPTRIWDQTLVVNPEHWLPCWVVSSFFRNVFQSFGI